MNCPGHVEIYNHARRSYRDLPLRLAEQGLVHRNEASGVDARPDARAPHHAGRRPHLLHAGTRSRTRSIGCLELAAFIYETLGLPVRAELSTRPDKRIGSEEQWDRMEAALATALARAGWDYRVNAGDGAFYAPKIDLHMTDSIGRGWQMGTIQLDAMMPERFDATYTSADDQPGAAVHDPPRAVRQLRALHRHPDRALRRRLPALARAGAGRRAADQRRAGARTPSEVARRAARGRACAPTLDERDEKVGRKIRDAEEQKVPAMLVVGEREAEASAGLAAAPRAPQPRRAAARRPSSRRSSPRRASAGSTIASRQSSPNSPFRRGSSPPRHLIVTRSRLRGRRVAPARCGS